MALPTGSPGADVNPSSPFQRLCICLLACALGVAFPAVSCAVVLGFDEVSEGTVLNEHYADMGIHISATGTGLDEIIAAVPCESPVSPPHVLSYQALGECPSARDEIGWFVLHFDRPLDMVAITAVHRGPDTVAYLEAYGVHGFIDVDYSVPGAGSEGVPQRLVVAPPPDRPRITDVLFGVEREGESAYFDDLEFEVVVAVERVHWGTWKASWR